MISSHVRAPSTTTSTPRWARRLDGLADDGPFVVLDLHSYNHRRGSDAGAGPDADNPEVNVGTGSLDRARWAPAGRARSSSSSRSSRSTGHRLDVRENVRFHGGHFARWVNDRYAGARLSRSPSS